MMSLAEAEAIYVASASSTPKPHSVNARARVARSTAPRTESFCYWLDPHGFEVVHYGDVFDSSWPGCGSALRARSPTEWAPTTIIAHRQGEWLRSGERGWSGPVGSHSPAKLQETTPCAISQRVWPGPSASQVCDSKKTRFVGPATVVDPDERSRPGHMRCGRRYAAPGPRRHCSQWSWHSASRYSPGARSWRRHPLRLHHGDATGTCLCQRIPGGGAARLAGHTGSCAACKAIVRRANSA